MPKKPISGAAGRRKKFEREEAAAAKAEKKSGNKDDGAWAEDFKAAGEPDLENPDTDLAYVRKLQLICLHQMATTPFPSIAQQAAWRRVREMSATVGMTHPRAVLEARVKKLVAELADRRPHAAAKVVDGKTIVRPPTARGARRGPRPVPNEAPEPAALAPSDKGTPADAPSITPPTEPEPEQ